MADEYVARAKALRQQSTAANPKIYPEDIEWLKRRDNVMSRLAAETDPEKIRKLESLKQETEKRLDLSFSKREEEPTIGHKAKVLATSIPKGLMSVPAGLSDIVAQSAEATTGKPAGASDVEWVRSLFPRPINTDEERLEGIGEFIGSAGLGGLLNLARTYGTKVGKFSQGAATDAAGQSAAMGVQELDPENPYAPIAAAMLAGGAAQTATSFPQHGIRAAARDATQGLTPDAPKRMVEDQAVARESGVEVTPAQTEAGTPVMRATEEWVAAMPDSKVRAMQQGQTENFVRGGALRQFPGQVQDRELLALMGRDVAAKDLAQTKEIANQAMQAVFARGRVPAEQVEAIYQNLQRLKTDSRFAGKQEFQNYLQDLQERLYQPVIVQEPTGGRRVRTPTGLVDQQGRPIMRSSVEPVGTAESEMMVPVTDPSRLKDAQQDALGAYKPTGEMSNPQARLRSAEKQQVKAAMKEGAPVLEEADRKYRQSLRIQGYQEKAAKSELGGWAGPKGNVDDAAAPLGQLTKIIDKGIDPNLPRSQSPPIRMAQHLGKNAEGEKFFANALKTKLSELISTATEESGPAISKSVSNPRIQRNLQDLGEAYAITAGRPEASKQVAAGLNKFTRVLGMIERRSKAGQSVPLRGAELESTKRYYELLGAAGYAPSMSRMVLNKLPWSSVSEGAMRTIDEKLTTPEGIEFLMKLAKVDWKSDVASGMVLGFMGGQAQTQQ